jgi:2-polyprenyl-6-methoxyphenol hydroxylase-like FAD-dependent oxidoreductase
MVPIGRAAFDFPALTYFSERSSDRIAYLTVFPVGTTMRTNLFTYREMDDPWFRQMRRVPEETLHASLPKLRKLTGSFKIAGEIRIRPADLYVSMGYRQAGIVLVGDAFATSCPVTGTGTDKVFTDVAQLCNVHIPDWLSSDGMGEDKIAAFYDDPVKRECDAWSAAKAYSFRSVTIDNGLAWQAQRWARFAAGLSQGTLRRVRNRLGARSGAPQHQARPTHRKLA